MHYDPLMRTTVELPEDVHRRVKQLAAARGVSMSAVVADLTTRGLSQLHAATRVITDPETGLPQIDIGRALTLAEAADLAAED